jgi:NTP pyrophosphatase (non-canonical NTP hydrolase)
MNFDELKSKIIGWAMERKIIPNSTPQTQLLKTMSELGELADATIKGNMTQVIDGYGDVLVTLIVAADLHGVDLTYCLERAYAEIKDRKGTLMPNGVFVKE